MNMIFYFLHSREALCHVPNGGSTANMCISGAHVRLGNVRACLKPAWSLLTSLSTCFKTRHTRSM